MSDGDLYLLPAHLTPYPLGRVGVWHDPANRGFRALVSPPARSPVEYQTWFTRAVFDQGSVPSCTAQASTGLLFTSPHLAAARPDLRSYDEPSERDGLYEASKLVDPYPGVDYDGTSTDAPFRILRDRGVIGSWRWLFGEPEVREYVRWFGPVVVGTVWLDGMFDPDRHGRLDVTGPVVGGHAYRIAYFSPSRHAYRIVNSWGRSWGDGGRAWIDADALAALLDQDGDAVVIG